MAQLTVANDEREQARFAAERLTQLIESAVANHGTAFVSLTGGTTPRRLYATLADAAQPWRDRIQWSRVHVFWGDERHVPPDHPDSNYGMAKATLLDHVPIPPDHVHRVRGEMPDARDAATDYEQQLHTLDITLLGVGEDAHIASIFPGSELLDTHGGRRDQGRRVAAVWAAHLNAWRITLTPEGILDSRAIVVLVSGANKANAVRAALEDPVDVKTYPAQLLRGAGDRVEWFLDRAAATARAASVPRPS